MIQSEFRFTLDTHAAASQVSLGVKKGETGRRLRIHLTEAGYPYHIPDNCYAVFTAKKPDGNKIFNDCVIQDCEIFYDVTEQTVSATGLLLCAINLYGVEGELLISATFQMIVYSAPVDQSDIESTSEYKALATLIAEAQALKDDMEEGGPGGYYLPTVEQVDDTTLRISFAPSSEEMPAVDPAEVKLPEYSGDDSTQNAGLTDTEKNLILTLFKNAAYTSAGMGATMTQLEALWSGNGSGDSDGGDAPDNPDNPEVISYTVTNNLTNVTNSNTATTATGYYSATLSAEDGYVITVNITMGGVDVTDSVYTEDGTILIAEVTGDIVITATAELASSPVLYQLANTPVTCNADLYEDTGLTFGASDANGLTKAWTICVDAVVTTNQKALFGVNITENAKCLDFQTNGASAGLIYICNNSNAQSPANSENRHRFVITHAANASKVATIHMLTDGEVVSTEVTGSYGNFGYSGYAGSLHIGGRTAAAFIGTINEFTIYEGVLSDAHIADFLGVA